MGLEEYRNDKLEKVFLAFMLWFINLIGNILSGIIKHLLFKII